MNSSCMWCSRRTWQTSWQRKHSMHFLNSCTRSTSDWAMRHVPSGASGARGPFVARSAAAAAGLDAGRGGLNQIAWGADAEYSRDHYLVRAEAIVSAWRLPIVAAPAIDGPVRAVSTSVEGRYRIRPGLYAAARLDHLAFSEIVGTTRRDEWDAPVTRLEIGGGYSLMRNLVLKLAWQRNTRDTTRTPSRTFVAAQAVFWF